MAVDETGMPLRTIVTEGTVSDITKAKELTEGIKTKYLIADKGYDSNEFIEDIEKEGMIVVIPPRSNRIIQRDYNRELYRKRHRIENTFQRLKEWRGIATRYAKNIKSFIAFVQIRCMMLLAKIVI
jgi:transposase